MAKILIVDDSIVMRKNLTTILQNAGHIIVGEASNGRQAIALYNELQPDIVTMDISMPIMSGVEAVRHIIKDAPEANIIMISAVNQKKMVFNAINSGAKHYIIKPIDAKKVIGVINEVLDVKDNLKEEVEDFVNVQGFQIDNVEGKFIITFNDNFDRKDQNLLNMAVRGILFIKPLKVVFNFLEIFNMTEVLLAPIIKLMDEIKSNGGDVSVQGDEKFISEKLKGW